MKSARHTFRARYGETDKMGFVYYGNYPEFFEVGRVELFRDMGISYKKLEDEGILMPVLQLHISYLKPLYYDELFILETTFKKWEGLRVFFEYKIFNEKEELTTQGETELIFISKATGKPIKIPKEIMEILS